MPLSKEQLKSLINMIETTEPDTLDCDGCFEHLAEFAERELANREIPDALKAVSIHLKQCSCCQDEYKALLEGLKSLDD